MKFWKDARAAYLAVQPPEELEEAVRAGIRTAKRKERERREPRPVIRYALCGAATLCMAFVIAVNASPVLAQSLYELPVVETWPGSLPLSSTKGKRRRTR